MRTTLFASAAALTLAVCLPLGAPVARAQSTGSGDTMTTPANPGANPGAPPAATSSGDSMSPGSDQGGGMATESTNETPRSASARSNILAPLPSAGLPADDSPQQYLQAAQQALQHRRAGEAEEALSRAETRVLDRVTLASNADQPDASPLIRQIAAAREAARQHRWSEAQQAVSDALNDPALAQGGQSGDTGISMGGAGGPNGTNTGGGAGTVGGGATPGNGGVANPPGATAAPGGADMGPMPDNGTGGTSGGGTGTGQ